MSRHGQQHVAVQLARLVVPWTWDTFFVFRRASIFLCGGGYAAQVALSLVWLAATTIACQTGSAFGSPTGASLPLKGWTRG